IATPPKLSRIEARRLQLAAEEGGGIGLLLRSKRAVNEPYAAATRWLVEPARGNQQMRRWKVQLIHGHGGRIGQSVLLEMCRETNLVRAADSLANRSNQTPANPASA
ncbi:MAG: hypothetical protein JO353_13465, partial [Phycisphaerae bacterium]|nr:hypothetical protein [Phycisphaerae bacterium]